MIVCNECGTECSAHNSLSYHLRSHGLTYPEYVVKHEHGGTWPTCLNCKKPLPYKNGGFSRFCSRSCSSSGEFNPLYGLKGESSPNFGKVRTEEHRKNHSVGAKKRWKVHGEKLRRMMKTKEYRAAQAESQRDFNQRNPQQLSARISAMHRFWSSDSDRTRDARKAASNRAIILLEEGKIGPHAPFKRMWMTNTFTGKDELMHSSWESSFLDKCILAQYPVTKVHNLRIPYVDADGIERIYVPDFVALEEKVVFEIKGLMTENDALKIAALDLWAEVNGYEVVVVDRKP